MGKKRLIGIILTLLASSASSNEVHETIIGKWQSDETLTLEDMNRHSITTKARDIFEDDFFGKLIIIIRKNEFASYFLGEDEPKFEPYEIIESNENSITIQYYWEYIDDYNEMTLYLEDDYLYIPIPTKWEFNEYFRRIE